MDLQMLASSKELHPSDLTPVQARNELLHFCQCLHIPMGITKDNYYKNVKSVIEQKVATKQDLSLNLDYRRMFFWHLFSLFILDFGYKRISDFGQEYYGYNGRMNMILRNSRRYKQIVENCIDTLKSLGLNFYMKEQLQSSTDINVTTAEATPGEVISSEGKTVQDELTLSSDESDIGGLDDVASVTCVDNNLTFISDTDSNHNISPEINLSKQLEHIGCQTETETERSEIAIGDSNVTTCDTEIQWEGSLQLLVQNSKACQYEVPLQLVVSNDIYTQYEGSTKTIGIQCEVPPQQVLPDDIGINLEVSPQQVSEQEIVIQCDVVPIELYENCNPPLDEELIDSYIADTSNHQALTHKGTVYNYVLVQKNNLKVLNCTERTNMINECVTVTKVDNRRNLYSCNLHNGECIFVNVKGRAKSSLDNHVDSCLFHMVCNLCKKSFSNQPGFAQHITSQHKNL